MPSSQAFSKTSFANLLRRMWQSEEAISFSEKNDDALAQEHGVLLRHYGELQRRCSEQARVQAREIEDLHQEVALLRAQIIAGDKALAREREEREKRLNTRTNDAGHELSSTQAGFSRNSDTFPQHPLGIASTAPHFDADWIERSLRTADLVICQTGCVSHSEFWRVQDHCKRTGKACVLVEQPGALQILRIHPTGQTEQLAAASLSDKDLS